MKKPTTSRSREALARLVDVDVVVNVFVDECCHRPGPKSFGEGEGFSAQ